MTLHHTAPPPRVCQLKPTLELPATASTMAADEVTLHATPKRKRGEHNLEMSPLYTTAQFSFRLPDGQSDDDGSASPRTKVAHRFKGLNLDERGSTSSGGGVPAPALRLGPSTPSHPLQHVGPPSTIRDSDDDDEGLSMRKRQKVPEVVMRDIDAVSDLAPASPTPAPKAASSVTETSAVPEGPELDPELESVPFRITPGPSTPSEESDLRRSYPSINRLQESKSRSRRKRPGTPPLVKGRKKKHQEAIEEGVPEVVDPLRASLTWHEDEITVYDPDDSDDDGTGVNGIGFKPTPALARIRTQKRKQQLLEYKKREDREARARRNQRRQGSITGASSTATIAQQAMDERRVRFMEANAGGVLTTI